MTRDLVLRLTDHPFDRQKITLFQVIKEIIESESSFVRELNSTHQLFLSLLHESQM